jgi:hypothetical protein
MPPGVVAGFAVYGHRGFREHRGGVKQRAVMLAAVEAVTDADAVRATRGHDADVAA